MKTNDRRPAPRLHPAAKTRTPDAATVEAPDRRPAAGVAQTGAGSVAAPLAPTAANPSQSAQTDRNATTGHVEPVSEASRRVARAILSTLTPYAAACILSAFAGLAAAIINAASTLRHATGEGAKRVASKALDAAACDGFDALDGEHTETAAYAVGAAWWFSTPCDVVASFWRSADARMNVEAQARGVLAEVDVMRREVAQNEPSDAVRFVEGLPFPAVRLASGETLVNPDAVRPLARGGGGLPEGVEALDARGRSWSRTVEAPKLEAVDSTAPRVLRVETPPFAAKRITAAVGRVLYAVEGRCEGYVDIASGLGAIVSDEADALDAAGLVSGLARVAAMNASAAVEAREVCDVRTHLNNALDALDAAGRVARTTLDALDAAPREGLASDVKVSEA